MKAVIAVDATAINALENLREKLKRHGKHLILSGARTQPHLLMEKTGFIGRLGERNVCPDLAAAAARARELLTAAAA